MLLDDKCTPHKIIMKKEATDKQLEIARKIYPKAIVVRKGDDKNDTNYNRT